MKRIVFVIVLAVLFFLSPQISSSQVIDSSAGKIEYELPYPGLLPDSPLYFLKVTRDRMVSFMITDPLKKAEFSLLTANKRLNAAVYLFNKRKGKEDLAYSTVSKGENYFEEAVLKAKEAKEQGSDVRILLGNLSLSAKKYEEVLKSMEEKAPVKLKESFSQARERVLKFEKTVETLKL